MRTIASLLFLLLAACATDAPERPRTPESTILTGEQLQIQGLYQELKRLHASLSDTDVQATAPDCARIAQLRDNICDLAGRICRLGRPPPPGSTMPGAGSWECIDGQLRCKNAVERAQARGCPKK
jgi:hypothetical protein